MRADKAKAIVEEAIEIARGIEHPLAPQLVLQALLVKDPGDRGPSKRQIGDWKPRESEIALGKRLGLQVNVEAKKMRDWARAGGKMKTDWDATFCVWLRRTAQRLGTKESEVEQVNPEEVKAAKARFEAAMREQDRKARAKLNGDR